MISPETAVDAYKLDHRRQYDPRVDGVLANFTARGSRIPDVKETVVFGLQYFLKRYLMAEWTEGFFAQPEDVVAARYTRRVNGYLGPNSIGQDHIRPLHRLGYLPLVFRALPEGTAVPLRVPQFTVQETIPEFFWLVNYIESLMSCTVWGPATSATQAREMRKVLVAAAQRTGTPVEFVDWQGHDFSFRGMFGLEAACLSGAGHLLFFTGTDTVPAVEWVEQYYGGMPEGYLVGGSVAATEHSVMCAGGEEGELETYDRLLDLYPQGILSVVSDTWDLWKVVTEILPALKGKILARAGKLVVRPDSGDPVKIICGDPDVAGDRTPARKGVIELLWDIFGGTVNDKGFKVLDEHVGAIYGDSINRARAREICERLEAKGFASGNIVLGVGSYTYQYVTRDTFMAAVKSTWVRFAGEGRPIFKSPKTDDGTKNSAKGRIAVLRDQSGTLCLVDNASPEDEARSLLVPTWRDGQFLPGRDESFDVVRARARGQS